MMGLVDAGLDLLEVEGVECEAFLAGCSLAAERRLPDRRRDRRDRERAAQKIAPVEAGRDDLAHGEIVRRVDPDIA